MKHPPPEAKHPFSVTCMLDISISKNPFNCLHGQSMGFNMAMSSPCWRSQTWMQHSRGDLNSCQLAGSILLNSNQDDSHLLWWKESSMAQFSCLLRSFPTAAQPSGVYLRVHSALLSSSLMKLLNISSALTAGVLCKWLQSDGFSGFFPRLLDQ